MSQESRAPRSEPTETRHGFRPAMALSGTCLIAFFLVAEVIPVSSNLASAPPFFTVHFALRALPRSWLDHSALWLAVPAAALLLLSVAPLRGRKVNRAGLASISIGLAFFPLAAVIPHAVKVGPLWALLFFVWLGLNGWLRDMDYFYASVVASFIWDLGAGVQGLMYGYASLPEPYGNGIPPAVVAAVDSAGALVSATCWVLRLDLEPVLSRFAERVRRLRNRESAYGNR